MYFAPGALCTTAPKCVTHGHEPLLAAKGFEFEFEGDGAGPALLVAPVARCRVRRSQLRTAQLSAAQQAQYIRNTALKPEVGAGGRLAGWPGRRLKPPITSGVVAGFEGGRAKERGVNVENVGRGWCHGVAMARRQPARQPHGKAFYAAPCAATGPFCTSAPRRLQGGSAPAAMAPGAFLAC